MKLVLPFILLFAGSAYAGQVTWAHKNGTLTSNGQLTVKSVVSGSYTGSLNPTGVVVKTNQSAVTQPPTVIIKNQSVNRWSMYYGDRASGLPGSD